MAQDIKLKRGEIREIVVTKHTRGVERALFKEEVLKMLKETHQEHIIPTFESMINNIKRIGVSKVVTGTNVNGEEKALAWCADHIYTLNIKDLADLVNKSIHTLDKEYEGNDLNNHIIFWLDDTDEETLKKITSIN